MAAVRVEPLWRVQGRMSGEDRHSKTITGPAVGCDPVEPARVARAHRALGFPNVVACDAASITLRNGRNDGARRDAGVGEFRPLESVGIATGDSRAGLEKFPPIVARERTPLMSRDHILHRVRTAIGRSAGQPPAPPPPVLLTRPSKQHLEEQFLAAA